MKIISGISGINNFDIIKSLADAGLDEFFIGYVPEKWSNRFGYEVSCNRRQYSNFQYKSVDQLASMVDFIHNMGKKIFLTFNAHEYNTEQIKIVYNIIKEIEHIPFDTYIVGNLGLMLYLRDKGIEVPFNLSIGAACNNYESIEFYIENIPNIKRIILPRKLTIKEIEDIALKAKSNNIKLEAFGMAFICTFNDEYCFTWHDSGNECFCASPFYENKKADPIITSYTWKEDIKKVDFMANLYNKRHALETKIKELKAKHTNTRQISVKQHNDFNRLYLLNSLEKCGICSFQKFKEWGIDAVKLPLRGYSHDVCLGIIKLTREAVDYNNATVQFCQNLIGNPLFCKGNNCYYNYPYSN